MTPDAFPVEPVMRLWGLVACVAVLVAILGCRTLSRALDYLARRRAAINPPSAPNRTLLVCQDTGVRNRFAVDDHQQAPPTRALTIGLERAHVLDQRDQTQSAP